MSRASSIASAVVVALVAGTAGCSSSKPVDACTVAFHKVQPVLFHDAKALGPPAFVFGMACSAMTGDDYECITRATDEDGLKKCTHVQTALSERLSGPGQETESPTLVEDFARIADAVCACPDSDCILAVGQREHAFELPRKPLGDRNPAKVSEERLQKCLLDAKAPSAAAP